MLRREGVVCRSERRQHQHGLGHARNSEGGALFCKRHAKAVDLRLDMKAYALCAVTVGIGLDHGIKFCAARAPPE